ncbi:MAG: hypothetical protein ACLFNZ_08175 [Spirochaetaceae bacterium]
MKVLEIHNIEKKDIPLYYRNEYTGKAVLEYGPHKVPEEKSVEFILERSATGAVDISARFLDQINYPLLPALKVLKNYIRELDQKGKLL